jgi:hypothetical protein
MKKKSPGILAPIDDKDAMIYFGHLAAQAEIALPGAKREEQIALAWLAAHVACQGARIWSAKLEDVVVDQRSIGSWQLQARTAHFPADRITMERYATLHEDGRQIAALAHTFLNNPLPEGAARATESVLDFSIMTLAAGAKEGKISASLKDMYGTRTTVRLRETGKPNFLTKFFSTKNIDL